MVNIPDYIDNTIKSIDERIAEVEQILEFLKNQRKAAIESKTGVPANNWYYFVASRTGDSSGHEILRTGSDGLFTCSCPAGRNGRVCWAKRGIMENTDNTGRPTGLGGFYDDGLVWRPFGSSQRSWYDAKRNT